MNKLYSIIAFLVIISTLASCSKNNPPTGAYIGKFEGNYMRYEKEENLVLGGVQLQITETDNDHIIINGSRLEKDGKKIKGTLNDVFFNQGGSPITIDGKRVRNNGHYDIEGTFESTIIVSKNPWVESVITGTFTIDTAY